MRVEAKHSPIKFVNLHIGPPQLPPKSLNCGNGGLLRKHFEKRLVHIADDQGFEQARPGSEELQWKLAGFCCVELLGCLQVKGRKKAGNREEDGNKHTMHGKGHAFAMSAADGRCKSRSSSAARASKTLSASTCFVKTDAFECFDFLPCKVSGCVMHSRLTVRLATGCILEGPLLS